MKKKTKAESLELTSHRVGLRTQVYINGYAVLVSDSCLAAIKLLSKSSDFQPAKILNAAPDNVPRYVYKWENDFCDPKRGGSSQLRGVKLFENNRSFGWRLVVGETK